MDTYIATNYEQCIILASSILKESPVSIGFDTETTVGRVHASTLQLSTGESCYIFQLYRIFKDSGRLPNEIFKILQSPHIIKIGCDLSSDVNKLNSYGIILQGTIDIQSIARTMLIPDINLDGLASKFFPDQSGKKRFNIKWDWDIDLNEKQIKYAAKDAHLSLAIYYKIISGVAITNSLTVNTLTVNDDPGEKEYLEWLKELGHTSTLKIDKVINQTVNSYGPWAKKYTKNDRATLSRQLILKFKEEGRI
jgi:hypothetical protein